MKKILTKHPLQTFIIMMVSALVLGLGSFNIFYLLNANIQLVIDYGFMALMDGALKELLLLALYGIVSLVAYVVFKACEKWLVEYILKK